MVRYGLMRSIGQLRHNLNPPPERSAWVVVRTERGVELGEVIAPVAQEAAPGRLSAERLREFTETNGPDYPLRRDGKVLRLANPQDLIDYRHLQGSAREEAAYCRQQIADLGLEMKLVTVEHLLGGERIIFYFSAEHRVDFRELVRRLAGQYRTRIEMRQVGARDEARLVADYERCGQQCCCQRFLKDLKPVSMRMAKTQKATLDPSKISGRCGRLMCCLRYEDTSYEELRARLPKRNTWVRTAELKGKVVETQILTQLVRLQLPDNSRIAVANEDIVERDVEPPPPPEVVEADAKKRRAEAAAKAARVQPAERPPEAAPEAAPEAEGPPAPEPVAAGEGKAEQPEDVPGKKRRRGRRRRQRRPAAQAPQVAGAPQQPAEPAGQVAPEPAAKQEAPAKAGGQEKRARRRPPRRRRRKRRKR